MTTMRAKMTLASVHRFNSSETLQFNAVGSGTPEDNSFSKYTPVASVSMSVTNPDLLGKFTPGETFYVDFTPATN